MNTYKHNILVIDDDESVTASLSLFLKQKKFAVLQANSPALALELLEQKKVDLILQDMNFSRATSGEEGLELLEKIRSLVPGIPVILMTAWGSISLAVEGMRLGASDFISKPWDDEYLLRTIKTAIGLNSDKQKLNRTRQELEQDFDFSGVIGESTPMLAVLNTVARVCKTDASILILGESGTGKEIIADAIHRNSTRNQSPIVKVNLGGITPSLFESEMFGHVKGAFTDAKQERQGRFSTADKGTLFLDEIGELDKSS
ncbi:MAG: sigma 54-interacting transcriptional regulator, partial [Kangiellaceae bacterium]|nr:sigma 54-interacting transcriptional regulator [Kangiellaceae bacterium]